MPLRCCVTSLVIVAGAVPPSVLMTVTAQLYLQFGNCEQAKRVLGCAVALHGAVGNVVHADSNSSSRNARIRNRALPVMDSARAGHHVIPEMPDTMPVRRMVQFICWIMRTAKLSCWNSEITGVAGVPSLIGSGVALSMCSVASLEM